MTRMTASSTSISLFLCFFALFRFLSFLVSGNFVLFSGMFEKLRDHRTKEVKGVVADRHNHNSCPNCSLPCRPTNSPSRICLFALSLRALNSCFELGRLTMRWCTAHSKNGAPTSRTLNTVSLHLRCLVQLNIRANYHHHRV